MADLSGLGAMVGSGDPRERPRRAGLGGFASENDRTRTVGEAWTMLLRKWVRAKLVDHGKLEHRSHRGVPLGTRTRACRDVVERRAGGFRVTHPRVRLKRGGRDPVEPERRETKGI